MGGRGPQGPTRAESTRAGPACAPPELGEKQGVSPPSACGLGSLLQPKDLQLSWGSRGPRPALGGGLAEGGATARSPSCLRRRVHTEPYVVSSAPPKLPNGNI